MNPWFWALGIAALLGYLFVWYLFMASPARRSLRSVLFLVATSPLLVAAAFAAFPLDLLIIGLLVGIWLAGLWDLNHVLAPMDSREVRFDEALGRIRGWVLGHERQVRPDDWEQTGEAHVAVLRQAVAQARALDPPASEWAELRESLIRALEFDATVYQGDRVADTITGAASFARWEQLKRDWDNVRSARSRFLR